MFETTFATETSTTVAIPDGFNANCKIINNSGVDVMVLDGVERSDSSMEVLFEQDLKILPADGSNIIKNGASATIVLNDSYYDTDSQEWCYSYAYNLMIVQANNLFPVKVVGVMANFDNYNYDDITVTAGNASTPGDYQNMVDSQAFQQNLMAFPDSQTSTDFVNVCNNSLNNSTSDEDIDSRVDAFFAGTDNYKNVTLNSLTAIQTYWESFPFIWSGYAASKSYYLYGSDSSTVNYLGSLDITAPTASPASVDKKLPGFTFTFTPADTKYPKQTLQYVKGQFVDSISSTTIALKGVYQLKSQFTNVPSDNKVMAYMSGSVNGTKVIGYNEQLKKDANGDWSGLYTLLHPKDAAGWMALILEVGAVVMTLELFSRPLKYLMDKFKESKAKKNGEEPTKEEAEKSRSEAKNRQSQDVIEGQKTMDRMGSDINIKIEINVNDSVTKLQTERTNRTTEDSRTNYTEITNRQAEGVKTLSKYSVDANIQKMSSEIGANKAALDPAKTTTEQLAQKMETVKSNANSAHETLPVEATKLSTKTTTAEKAALDGAKHANEEALELQEEIEKNKDTSEKGDDGSTEMDDLPKGGEE